MAYCPNCGCTYDESEYSGCPYCHDDNDERNRKLMEKEYERRQKERERRSR